MAKSRLEEIREVRLEKIVKLLEMGIDPYPSKSEKEFNNQRLIDNFDSMRGDSLTVAGRLMSWREHGGLIFADLQDASGQIQLFIKEDHLEDTDVQAQNIGFGDLNLLDVGDFVQVTGELTKTSRGEISVLPKQIKLLSKSIRPLPEKHEGLKDPEERMRRRYLDTTVNRDVYERFIRRSKFWEVHREFFKQKGFIEINTPVLEHIPGGGEAKPFVTHMDAIDEDFYLRISQELYLKRFIGGGYEKVYEIGPRFRNEGLSDEHLPEHIAMEFYWAYADWKDGMEFIKQLYEAVLDEVYEGKKEFKIRGYNVDFSKGWEEMDFGEIFEQEYGVSPYDISIKQVKRLLDDNNIEKDFQLNVPRGVDNLWKNLRKDIAGPTFLINHPRYLSPLQKPHSDNPKIVERFQPIIAGSELGNGWSEVNNPVEQYERFYEQQKLRDEGDEEAQWLDIDYVEMLEYGMPPTFGWGHSERLFWYLEDVPARQGVPYPQLKYKIPKLTREIYKMDELSMDGLSDSDDE